MANEDEDMVELAFCACLRTKVLSTSETEAVSKWCSDRNIVIPPQTEAEEPEEDRFEQRNMFMIEHKAVIDRFLLVVQLDEEGLGFPHRVLRQDIIYAMRNLAVECDQIHEILLMQTFKQLFYDVQSPFTKGFKIPLTFEEQELLSSFSMLVFKSPRPHDIPYI
jgi:hypothetical protein